jgi:hypothetical protein
MLRAALALAIGAAGAAAATPPAAAVGPDDPVQLAVIVPLVVPAEKSGLINAEALTRYTSPPLGTLTRQLDAVAGRDVTLAIDPRIITSIRVLGTSAPPSATAWLRRLESLPNESVALPYANADVTLATQAGAPTVPAPTSFAFAVDAELFPAPEPSPSASPLPPETAPTTESLLAWPHDHEALLWPTDSSVITTDLQAFAASGYRTVLLSSENVEPGSRPVARVGEMDAVIADAPVSLALREAVSGDTDPALALTALTAAIGDAAAGQPGDVATVVATLGRGVPLSDSRLATVLDALDADARIELVPLSAVTTTAPDSVELVDRPHEQQLLNTTRELIDLDARLAGFSQIVAEPELLRGERRLALLSTLDTAWASNPAGWELAAAEFAEASQTVLDAVQIVDSSDVNFFTDRSSIQVPVRNDLDQPVTVILSVVPDRPLLAVENDRVEVTIEPQSVRNAPVPVQSISNGTVRLTMTLQGAAGEQVGSTARLTVNVQAGWEGPIVVAVAAVVVLVFAGGLVRNIVSRRRERE